MLLVENSYIFQNIIEKIYQKTGITGKTYYKSDNPNYVVKTIEGNPTEIKKVKRHPQSKHRSQKLYKSPGTRRKAVWKAKVTKAKHKALGLYSQGKKEREKALEKEKKSPIASKDPLSSKKKKSDTPVSRFKAQQKRLSQSIKSAREKRKK